MSRTYKKTSTFKASSQKFIKRLTNKKVRASKTVRDGKFYKRIFNSTGNDDASLDY